MSEIKPSEFLKFAEERAINQIEGLANLENGMITQGQVIERITNINSKLNGFDLLIQSQTFVELAKATGQQLPKVNDRLLVSLKSLLNSKTLTTNQIFNTIKEALSKITEWDENLHNNFISDIKQLEKYTQIDSFEDLKKYTYQLIKTYHFKSEHYEDFLKHKYQLNENLDSSFEATLPFIERIGVLISIFESMRSTKSASNSNDIVLGCLKYFLDLTQVKTIHIVDFLPTMMRAVIRDMNYTESQVLQMTSEEIVYHCNNNEIGKILINLCKIISKADETEFLTSRIGLRLYIELKNVDFWNNIEYKPKLSLMTRISKVNLDKFNLADSPKATSRIGTLESILSEL